METKVLEIENLKEEIYELQKDNHSYSLKNIDLKRQIAMLQDGLEYQKDQADTYARNLRQVYSFLEDMLEEIDEDNCVFDGVIHNLKLLKNSIPESALRRGE